jgi:hypothetical protein
MLDGWRALRVKLETTQQRVIPISYANISQRYTNFKNNASKEKRHGVYSRRGANGAEVGGLGEERDGNTDQEQERFDNLANHFVEDVTYSVHGIPTSG